jgi:DNA repair protein RadA/Sms
VLRLNPSALVVDSIQTVYLDDLPSSAGSVVQVRECASALLQVAKRQRIPVFLVGHVTKSGDLAGPRVLEHIVDVVVYMEGARQQGVRLVRCVKNRYGATDEVGVFSMEEGGLAAVANPSALFLRGRGGRGGGGGAAAVSSAVTVVMEGSRPLLMEVQALCSPTQPASAAPPLRAPTGVRKERLWLILAVLGKHTPMRPYTVDVHLNVTGGAPPPPGPPGSGRRVRRLAPHPAVRVRAARTRLSGVSGCTNAESRLPSLPAATPCAASLAHLPPSAHPPPAPPALRLTTI